MDFKDNEKILLIHDFVYQEVLLKVKERYPLADIKLMSKEEVIDSLSVSFSKAKDPLPYLLGKEEYDYSKAKRLLHILRVGEVRKDPRLARVYDELKREGYLQTNPYGKYDLQGRKIYLFEDDEDYELKGLLARNGFAFEDLHFSDLGMPGLYQDKSPRILNFENKFQQYLYIFADMRKRLEKDPTLASKLLLFVDGASDLFYVSYFRNLFSLPVFTTVQSPLTSDEKVHQNLLSFHKNRNFVFVTEVKDGASEPVNVLKDVIKTYGLDHLQNFDLAYADLMEILSAKTMNLPLDDKGVRLTTEPSFAFTDKVYVTCFDHDHFYKEADDQDILSDSELKNLSVNPSYIKTRLERRLKANFIRQHEILLLSRPLLHLQDKIFDSQFVEEFGWKSKKALFFSAPLKGEEEKAEGPLYKDGVYPRKAERILQTLYLDENHAGKEEGYRDYDHTFDGIKNSNGIDHFSASTFKAYFDCPYYCYLEKVLKLSREEEQDYTAAHIGTLVHKVFENLYTDPGYEKDFDQAYEEAFERGVKAYRSDDDRHGHKTVRELTPRDQAVIANVHHGLKDIVREARKLIAKDEKGIPNGVVTAEKAEVEISLDIPDSDGNTYPFIGYIDKLVYTESSPSDRFVTLIDYKTGTSGDFDIDEVFLGGSLQLPLYELSLAKHPELTEGYHFGGFGIQHIYFSRYNALRNNDKNTIDEDTILKALRIGEGGGVSPINENYLSSIDRLAASHKKDGTYNPSNRNARFRNIKLGYDYTKANEAVLGKDDYPLTMLYAEALKAAGTMARKITLNEFPIAPTQKGKNGYVFCSHCPYKDICYHSKKDIVDISPAIKEHKASFATKEEEA